MAQELFTVGSFTLRSYGVIVAIAILLGLGVAYFLASDKNYREYLLDVVLYGIVGAIIGARLWQVLFYDWGYYSKNILEAFMIWHGGLAIQGALIGAFLAGWIYTRQKKISFWRLADIAAPGLILGQAVGRIACFLNGDAFGSPTNSGFGVVFPKGTYAYEVYGNQPLWPAEVWEGQWDIVVFALILMLGRVREWSKGFVFLSYVILYSSGRFALEFLRGDGGRYLFNWTSAQWSSVGMITLSLIFGAVLYLKSKTEGQKTALTKKA